MNLKINKNYIFILIFTSFLFFWGVTLSDLNGLFKLIDQPSSDLTSLILNKLKLSYLIIFLLIPIFYGFIKKRNFFPKEIFNNQKYIIIFTLFVFVHYVFIKFYYNEIFAKSEIVNLIYLLLISIIYCHYRNFILINFKKIVIFYLIILIIYSIYEGTIIYSIYEGPKIVYLGQCNSDLFLINIIREYTGISFGNSFYLENSHLAIMSVPVFFSGMYILVQEKKNNILFLLLFLIQIIIILTNLSTTYFICYFISQISLLFFFLKKLNTKFWIFTILLLLVNSYLFFSDKNCTVKVKDFKVKEVINKKLEKNQTNLTTLVYKRSAILALNTLKDHSFGWGIDGMDDATRNLMSKYDTRPCNKVIPVDHIIVCTDEERQEYWADTNKRSYWPLNFLNLKDGLSNFFKMFTEFGIFTFIIFYYFIRYILNINNLSAYNLFIIILFGAMCIRGVGYFSGGFIFCILELFYCKKFLSEFELKKINTINSPINK